ncbi:MAG: tRNA lysidine(34) synthetase TilS [Flavobacteriaceae bacterium]
MLKKFTTHIHQNLPFLKDAKLLVAISGGIDSVVLAHLCSQMQLNFSLAHCNFKLRQDQSDKDAAFVKTLAKELKVSDHSVEFQTQSYAEALGVSTQMAARTLRYQWFESLLNEHEYDYVLTAHHTNDNIETVLINLIRGTSIHGLTGIPEKNNYIVRPLLPFTRADIEEFTIKEKIIWREDETNQSTKYFRNKIRHKVIPVFEDLNPNLSSTFNTHLSYLKKEREVLTDHLDAVKSEVCIFDEHLKIDVKKLLMYKNIEVYLRHILSEYNFTEWQNVADLCLAQSGKIVLSETHRLIKDRDYLLLEENKVHLQDETFEITQGTEQLYTPIQLQFSNVSTVEKATIDAIFVDAEKLKYPLCIRKKKDGDVFFPFGMKGKKKLSKYFKDEKMSLPEKENCWLLCDANDTIIWVVSKRADNRFKVGKDTKSILKIIRS